MDLLVGVMFHILVLSVVGLIPGLVQPKTINYIGGVMVGVLASSAVDRRLEPRSDQTKDYNIGIYCFSAKHIALRRKSKDWLAWHQNNVSEWSDMSPHPSD